MVSRRMQAQSYAKPIIIVHPKGVIPLGGNFSITCKTEHHLSADFYLWKKGTCTKDFEATDVNEKVFYVFHAEQSDGQIYFCAYCFYGEEDHECSVYSDEVNVTIRDPSLSKPTIQIKPNKDIYPGSKVIFSCQGPENGLTFSLWKSNVMKGTRMAEPESKTVEFPLLMMKAQDSGNYSCHYQLKGNPFVWSLESESTKIVVNARSMAVIWANVAAGFLCFILLLFTFILCKKRRRGIISNERLNSESAGDNESGSPERDNESESGAERDNISEIVEKDNKLESVEKVNKMDSVEKDNKFLSVDRYSLSDSIDRYSFSDSIERYSIQSIERENEPEKVDRDNKSKSVDRDNEPQRDERESMMAPRIF